MLGHADSCQEGKTGLRPQVIEKTDNRAAAGWHCGWGKSVILNVGADTYRMDSRRIAELLAPFLEAPPGPPAALSQAQLGQVVAYLELLLRWNARINLTAVRDAEQMVTRHFGESLFAARVMISSQESGVRSQGPGLSVSSSFRSIDLGSGAGFPGLPIKIFAPSVALTLIESNQKKAAFLKEVVRALGLTGVNVFAGRGEEFSSKAELVTLRAVERYEQALGVAARLVEAGGRLGLLIGAAQAVRTPKLLPGMRWSRPVAIPRSSGRVILIGTNQAG